MNAKDITQLAKIINKLKKIKRSGWVREKIENPESVSDHSHGLTVLAMVIGKYLRVDREKLIKMAIIHDIAEVEIGDWVAERGRNIDALYKQEKEKKEEEIIGRLFKNFGSEYKEIFHEMIKRQTKEAKLFWQLDKLEMALQALDYESIAGKLLTEFYENAQVHIKEPLLKKILEEIKDY